MLISIPDSYFSFVAKRIQAMGATVTVNGATIPQPIGGMIDARDWPQTQIIEGALYLLIQRIVPGENWKSKVQRQWCFYCQWSWLLIGTNLAAGQQAANRGDRYRQSMQIMTNLKEGNFPGFCQKMSYGSTGNGVVTAVPAASTYPASATEMIVWDALRFMPKVDAAKSGVEYGAASVEVSGYDDSSVAENITMADVMGQQVEA